MCSCGRETKLASRYMHSSATRLPTPPCHFSLTMLWVRDHVVVLGYGEVHGQPLILHLKHAVGNLSSRCAPQ